MCKYFDLITNIYMTVIFQYLWCSCNNVLWNI